VSTAITHLPVSEIRLDYALQTRAAIDSAVVTEYAEAMSNGAFFPPIDVYKIGDHHVVADGFHRFQAHQHNGDATIPVIVHPGGRDAAIKHALKANDKHGLKRTNADKRRAVEIALKEFDDLSDSAIAQMCGVSQPFVGSLRPKQPITVIGSPTETPTSPPARKGLDGKVRKAPKKKATKAKGPKPAPALASAPIVKQCLAALSAASGETVVAVETAPCEPLEGERVAEIKTELATTSLQELKELLRKGISEYTPVPEGSPGFSHNKEMRHDCLCRMLKYVDSTYTDGQAQASTESAVDQMNRIPRNDPHRRKYLKKLRDYCETALAECKAKEATK